MTANIQQSFVPIETIESDLLSLRTAHRPAYRAIMEVSGLNYQLKSEEQQTALALVFQQILGGLKHSLQILLRAEPFQQEAYLRRFGESLPPEGTVVLGADLDAEERWRRLNSTYAHFFREQLGRERTLLERHFYLIVPADPVLTSEERLGVLLRGQRKQAQIQAYAQARQQLDLRCSELSRQLSSLGLLCRRLRNPELVHLLHRSLSQQQALSHPLHPEWIEAVGHLHQPLKKPPYSFEDALLSHQPSHTEWRLTPQWATLLAPSGIRLTPDALVLDEAEWVRTISVRQLPRFVQPGWLRPLVTLDEPLDLSLFYQPCPTSTIIHDLRRKQLEIDSSLKVAQTQGRSTNAEQEMASRDIGRLLESLAEGDTLLDLSLHVLVRGQSQSDLSDRAERVQAVLYNMLLHAQSALFEQDRGYRSCLPYALNELPECRIRLDSASASTSLPFLVPTSMMESERGILEGVTPSGDLVFLDWWSPQQRNANRLIVAPSGSGKSFKAKLDLIRTAQHYAAAGIQGQQIVIDPESEFVRSGIKALGGQWIRFAAGSTHQINPFDLPTPHGHDPHTDVLTETIRNAQALFDILLADRTSEGPGTLKSEEKGLLDRVLYAAYREKGITADRQTHTLPPPLLRDIHSLLQENRCGKDPTDLAARLERFVSGSLAGLFRGSTNVALDGPVIIMDTSDLDPELRPITLFLLANYIWTISFGSRIPRHLFIDELLSLYQYPEGRRFLETLFQRARKHYLGVTGMTQHLSILRESTIVSNCGSIALMGQEAASLDLLTEIFHLSPPERQHLLTFGKGDALLLTQEKRVCVHFACSDLEYRYATSHPADMARYEAEEQRGETSDETQQIAPVLPRK
jgi:hypothetical protein